MVDLEHWKKFAREDTCLDRMVSSDLRVLVGEIERLRYALGASIVAIDDWLNTGSIPGNLDLTGTVDFEDYSIFASYWLDYCPNNWPLK